MQGTAHKGGAGSDPILLVTQHYSPEVIGSAPYCVDLAEGMQRRGRHVTVLTGLPHYPSPADFDIFNASAPLGAMVNGVQVERLRHWQPRRRAAWQRIVGELLFCLSGLWAVISGRVERHDTVISLCPSIFAVLLGAIATRRGGTHIALIHDIQSGLARGLGMVQAGWLIRLMQWCERKVLDRVDTVFVLSASMADELREIGVRAPIEVLPIWVDTDAIAPQPEPDDPLPTLLYSGNFGRKQGLEQIVALAQELQQSRPDVRILLRGAGAEREALAARIAELNLGNIRFAELMPRELLAQGLAEGLVHLVPQRADGANFAVPSKIYTIMAAGRSFVATALPDTALWQLRAETDAFFCVPPDDAKAMADAALRLLDDPTLRRAMASRGREFVERKHARELLLDRIGQVLIPPGNSEREDPARQGLLVLEPTKDGHPEEWLKHLLAYLDRQRDIRNIWLVVAPELHDALEASLPPLLRRRVTLLALTPTEQYYCTHANLAVSGFARWWVMRAYLNRTGAPVGHFLAMDHLTLPLALGLGAGGRRLDGILFRPSVHYHAIGAYRPRLAEKLRDWRKDVLYRLMLRNPSVGKVLTLDPFFPDYAAANYPFGHKVQAVPDPAFPPPAAANDPGSPVTLPEGRQMLLLFGVLTERKGVLHLLEALRLLSPETAHRVAMVIAGKVALDIQAEFNRRVGVLRQEQPGLWLRVEDRWLSSAEIAALTDDAAIILAPYQRFVGSSGVLLWAARAGKPLLTQDYGLLGRLVRENGLGLAIDVTDPRQLAAGIEQMVLAGPDSFVDRESSAAFVSGRTPDAFAGRIFGSLRPS